ncbi:Na(+)/H(+) antiporter subunit C [Streptomyces sp. RFCAC02]|uniref:Na(+)/H(+) antiporter subunit C n=1 Tax=Streptomyces sp. RFCAC02 TaxID=2499143 RepID=UPI0019D0269F|nr:Na(+)/H(+) antiporter subunit C [Streptomyces sp. RFCAC02]
MRTLDVTMALVVGGLFATGVHLLLQRSLMRTLLGFILLGHGTNLLLLVAGGAPGDPPVVRAGDEADGDRFADPLPQAMALTAIVITFGVTTFLLALAYRSWRLSGHDEVRDDIEDRRIGTVGERADAEPATLPPDDDRPAGRDGGAG